jgi:hypothetical protein
MNLTTLQGTGPLVVSTKAFTAFLQQDTLVLKLL